ncbi:SDR family NAD(P)-dependent oxidoreductase [Desulfobacterales bacterium HSG16]|nr:SDR family NAD(P)-dependent oxidoreductase [Desulfobacterales bacterium HSG16]
MGRDVVCCFPQAFRSMEKAELQFSGSKQPLWEYIYPAQIRSQAERDSLEKSLRNTDIAQPAIGAVTLADIKILNMFGLFPDAACGHSFGELTALYAGGYIDEETFLQLAVARGKFMALAGKTDSDKTDNNNRTDDDYDANGAMLAVKAPLDALENIAGRIGQDIVLANRNSPEQGVLSGSTEAIERANKLCRSEGYKTILLPVSAAFHSHLVEDAAIPFSGLLKTIDIKPGTIPVFSNTTADPYPDDPDLTRKILGRQLAMPVNFCGQIQNMYDAGIRTFVEVGPKGILSGLIASILNDRADVHVIALDPGAGKKSGTSDLARVLCHLGSLGYRSKLSLWEYPLKAVEKQRMQIPVSGANYRSISDKKTKSFGTNTKSFDHKTKNSDTKTRDFDHKAKTPVTRKRPGQPEHPLAQAKSTIVKAVKTPVQTPAHQGSNPIEPGFMEYKSSNMKTNVVANALKAVQEGLKSMQAIQQQTADSHNHFLDTQKEASRTLQKMMESTGRLAEISMGFTDLLQPNHQEVETVTVSRQQTPSENMQHGNMPASVFQPEPEPVIKPTAPETSRIVQQPEPIDNGKNDKAKIADMAIQVVSDLTGYPVDMITQDMDIEADLGIDSIKRVEILSTLEERIPGLPQVSPDVMGSLKTLGQVVDYLMEESSHDGQTLKQQTAQERESEAPPAQTAFDSAGNNESNQKIGETLLNVVGRLTGYPVDMLSLDMDIEADLGIDSIKRVEILSSLEEEMAGLPSVSPEDMGSLKTLGQIVEYLSDTKPTDTKPADTNLAQAQTTSESNAAFTPAMENSKQVSSSPDASLDSEHIAKNLLQVVANLTGYPMDMLSLDMDIEADLGIDSIKRVEILSSLEEEIPNLPGVSPEDMGRLKTLGQIVEYLFESFGFSENTEAPKKKTKNIIIPETDSFQISPVMAEPAGRQKVRVIENPFKPGPEISLPAGTRIYLTDDEGAGIGEAIKNELADLGVEAEIISRDFCSKNAKMPPAAGLVIIYPSSRNRPVDQTGDHDSGNTQIDDTIFLKQAFSLAKTFGPDLNEAGRKSGAVFATITRLDGQFGFSKTPVQNPVQGGLAGLAKTAAIEWPQVKCHAFDIDPACDIDQAYVKQIAQAVADDLIHKGGPVEIGLSGNKRYAVTLEPSQYKEGKTDILKPGDLVVVTGGARGITASTCLALAHHSGSDFALLGRSPVPEAMPEWFEGLESEAEIKKAILQNEYSEEKIKPAQLESAYRKHMANLEILGTLAGLRAAGVKAEYYSVDIRDQKKTADVIDAARNLFGPVKALIHGAGVLKDRLIIEKNSEHFDMVFDTKVTGLLNLLASTADDPLVYMVFFSSVSARMGNQGQVDYSMANEVLNKIAQQEALRKPGTRVKSINWGPWDGGMVSSALKKEFEKNNVELIKIDRGAANLICEMKEKDTDSVEVVIGDGLPGGNMMNESSLNSICEPETPLCLTFKREIDLKMLPILGAHVLNGYPVVPFALMTEWLGHGALHENPGLFLHGLDDIRLLKGIRINNGTKYVRLLAGKPIKNGQIYEVNVELRDDMKEGRELIHSRAKAILTDVLEKPPAVNIPEYMNNGEYSRPMNEVYEKILFHGIGLHGIEEIKHCSARGMIAKISSAPAPEQWMVNPIRSKWIADPLVLDSAFQMAIVWCYEQLGTLCLPSYSASYRQYCRHFPKQGVTVLMEVSESGRHKMKSDFTFMDDEQNVVACLKGHEAIMDEALFEAFEKCNVL